MSFLLDNLFAVILILVATVTFFVRVKYRKRELFEIKGDVVRINPTPALKFSFGSQTKIPINSVVRIEIVDNRISLFQKSGNAIDIWIEAKNLEKEIGNAKTIFSNAEFISIGS